MKPPIVQPFNRHVALVFCAVVVGASAALAQGTPVPTYQLHTQFAESSVVMDGVVQPVRQSTVAAQATGRIATFLVKAGDKVRAGQLLATIDDRAVGVGTQRSQAQVNQADAELRQAQANLERTRDLQSKGFVSKAALDAAVTQREGAQAVREQASAAVRESGIAQGFTRVTAPFDGWVLQTHAETGDLAVPGKPMLTLYAPLPLRVVVQVPASRAASVRSATRLVVQVEDASAPLRSLIPTSRIVVPAADPVSQTTEWRLDLAPADSAGLVPGQQVHVSVAQPQAANSARLLLPRAAIVHRGELTAVYVVVRGAFLLRAVRLGTARADGVEVLAGVKAGEAVALDPDRAGLAHAVPAAPTQP